jgi:type II secretory pathway component PulK
MASEVVELMVMVVVVATVTVVTSLALWRAMRQHRRTEQITRRRIMADAQTAADAAEESTITRYREHRAGAGAGLTVSCGRCGSSQIVHPDSGLLRFALVCSDCHERTLFSLPGSP